MSEIKLSQRRQWTENLAISYLMKQGVENPQVISLAAGLVDPQTLPMDEVQQAFQRVFDSETTARHALQYGTTAGSLRLRQQVLKHFTSLEAATPHAAQVNLDQIIATTGSQQFLSLVCETLLDPGDICLLAGPTYFVFAGNLSGVGARSIVIPADDQGMRTDLLNATLQELEVSGELPRVKLIYVVSDHDNPSGVTTSLQRRQEIFSIAKNWSRHHRIMILEDAAYRELRYDGEPVPSLWSLDTEQKHVLYAQTFSKTFSPGVRVGYGIVPKEMVQPLCDRKGNDDFGSSHLAQNLMAAALETDLYKSHLQIVRDSYRTKRDAMLTAAEEFFSDLTGVSWLVPEGGLYVWMSLPERIPTGFNSPLFKAAVQEGVMYVPGELCYAGPVSDRPTHQMRLSYGVQPPEGIHKGMNLLANAVRKFL